MAQKLIAPLRGVSFVSLPQDCKLVGKSLTTTDLDLIFTKVKVRNSCMK